MVTWTNADLERAKQKNPPTKKKKTSPGGSTMHRMDSHAMREIREADRVSVIRDEGVRYAVGLEEALSVVEEYREDEGVSIRIEVSIGTARKHSESSTED